MIMSLELLEENWNSIVSRVIEPLWNYKFQSMYENSKLDKDDFYSLASLELTKAFKENYDESESNIYTYATHVLTKKAKTELRDCIERDKRKASHLSTSLNQTVSSDSDEEIISTIEDARDECNSELSEYRVGNFVNALSNQQLRVLILKLLGFESGDMIYMLNIPRKTMNDILKSLKDNELTGILYRRKF